MNHTHPRHQRRARGLVASALLAATGAAAVTSTSAASAAPPNPITVEFVGRHSSGDPDGGAEIVAFDPATARMFVTNGVDEAVDVVDIGDPRAPALVTQVSIGRPIQSVAVKSGLVAVATEGATRQAPGKVAVLDTDGNLLWEVTVGALPDMVTFTPDGSTIVTANEGEPRDYCAPGPGETALDVDPEGSISVIDVASRTVRTAGFGAYTDADALRSDGIRIFGPNASVAQDLEPEYIAITPDGATAYVTLQENNALAVVDLDTAVVTDLLPLGYVRHDTVPIDTSDRDGPSNTPAVNIATRNANVFGMYLPDGIASFRVRGQTYLAHANEGDAREYACFPGGRDDQRTSADGGLDPAVFSSVERGNAGLGRLRASSVFPATRNVANQRTTVYAYGTRSFTIRDLAGNVVGDSGAQFEQLTSTLLPDQYNGEWITDPADGTLGAFRGRDVRSPNKGPEPEGIVVGQAYGRQLAFVGLERIGGVMVYDVTDPAVPQFVQYINTSDFAGNYKAGTAGDVAPEGLAFVAADDSPTGKPLVLVSYELSGTTAIFEVLPPRSPNAAGGRG